MWTAKIRFSSEGTLIGTKAVIHKVDLFGFPLSYEIGGEAITVHIAGTIFGTEKSKRDFVASLKKEKRVLHFEFHKDFFIGTILEPLFAQPAYNKEIFYLSPAHISENGFELIHIGAFDKNSLLKVVSALEKYRKGELLQIGDEKVGSISIVKLRAELTPKQRRAMELAIKHGYYNSPRKIDVQQLAKLAKLSFSTYQVHLRKAEAKVMPYLLE